MKANYKITTINEFFQARRLGYCYKWLKANVLSKLESEPEPEPARIKPEPVKNRTAP